MCCRDYIHHDPEKYSYDHEELVDLRRDIETLTHQRGDRSDPSSGYGVGTAKESPSRAELLDYLRYMFINTIRCGFLLLTNAKTVEIRGGDINNIVSQFCMAIRKEFFDDKSEVTMRTSFNTKESIALPSAAGFD